MRDGLWLRRHEANVVGIVRFWQVRPDLCVELDSVYELTVMAMAIEIQRRRILQDDIRQSAHQTTRLFEACAAIVIALRLASKLSWNLLPQLVHREFIASFHGYAQSTMSFLLEQSVNRSFNDI